MALSPSRANIQQSGVSEWAIKDTARPDTGYAPIPFLRNGKIEIKTLETKNSKGQPVAYGYELSGSAQFPAVRTTANFVKLLDSLSTKLIDHRIKLINGQVISSKPSTSAPSPTGFGVKWKLVSDKDMDGDMYVEISISRRLTFAEYTQILSSVNADTTTAITGDTFYPFLSLTRADIVPAGIAKIELGAADAGTYLDDIDNLRNGKFTAELLTTKDSRGQEMGYAVKIEFEADGMETAEAELLKWDDIANRANDSKVTFVNGIVCTLGSALGISTQFTVDKDSEDIAILKVKGSGIIKVADWDSIWSN